MLVYQQQFGLMATAWMHRRISLKNVEFQDMETIEEYSYERHSGKNIKGL